MIPADAKCDDCKVVWEIYKDKQLDDFVLGECPQCGSKNVYRYWGKSNVKFSMATGNCGTSRDGFQSQIAYHPSEMGRFRGTRIK